MNNVNNIIILPQASELLVQLGEQANHFCWAVINMFVTITGLEQIKKVQLVEACFKPRHDYNALFRLLLCNYCNALADSQTLRLSGFYWFNIFDLLS